MPSVFFDEKGVRVLKFLIILPLLFATCKGSQVDIPFPEPSLPDVYVPDDPDGSDGPDDPNNPIIPSDGKVIHINSDGEYAEKVKGKNVTYFFATWCGPCKQQGPIYKEVSLKNPGIPFFKVDVDKCPQSAKSRGVSGIPTIFVGEKKNVGLISGGNLQRLIDGEF